MPKSNSRCEKQLLLLPAISKIRLLPPILVEEYGLMTTISYNFDFGLFEKGESNHQTPLLIDSRRFSSFRIIQFCLRSSTASTYPSSLSSIGNLNSPNFYCPPAVISKKSTFSTLAKAGIALKAIFRCTSSTVVIIWAKTSKQGVSSIHSVCRASWNCLCQKGIKLGVERRHRHRRKPRFWSKESSRCQICCDHFLKGLLVMQSDGRALSPYIIPRLK